MTVKYIDQSDNISWCMPGLQLGFEPTINHTRSEHANHYTTDAVLNLRTKRLKNKQYLTHVEGLNQPERNPNRTNHDWHV